MAWNDYQLGNLAQFPIPKFETGEGLVGLMELRQQQQNQIAQNLQGAVSGIAETMEQKKRDEIYNKLMDQYSKEFNINNPFAGQGEQGYAAATQLIKLRMAGQDQSLQERMAEARIAKLGQASGGGGGGSAPVSTEANVWTDDVTGRRYLVGPRGGKQEIKPPTGAGGQDDHKLQTRIDKLEKRRSELLRAAEGERQYNIQQGAESAKAAADEQWGFGGKKEKASAEAVKPWENKPFTREKELTHIENELAKLNGPPKLTDPEVLKKYWEASGHDKAKAEELAKADGWTW